MEKMTLRKSYVSALFVIDKNNIEDFELLPNHRQLRETQIQRIKSVLNQGKHFESPIVVNQIGKAMRIIDGGHRITAIQRFLEDNPEKSVEVNISIYRDLNKDEEHAVIKTWNYGIKQSLDDLLNLKKDEIPLYKLMSREFPCKVSVYAPSPTGMRFRLLCESYMSAKRSAETSQMMRVETFIDSAKELGHQDYKFLVRFMNGFIGVFGLPGKNNTFSGWVIMTALMRLYHDNCYEQGNCVLE